MPKLIAPLRYIFIWIIILGVFIDFWGVTAVTFCVVSDSGALAVFKAAVVTLCGFGVIVFGLLAMFVFTMLGFTEKER